MTSERRKSIVILIATLIAGLLLGLLIPGLFNKWERRGQEGDHGRPQEYNQRKEWFAGTLNKILRPDSVQAGKIRAITERAAADIDSVESSANRKMMIILDSVKSQLKPILTPEQQKSLDKFDAKAKKTWIRGSKRRH